MKRVLLLILVGLLSVSPTSAQKLKNFVLANTVAGGAPPPPTPSDFYHTTITVADGAANAFVYTPEDLDNPPVGGWPLIIHLNGDGTSNNTTNVVTAQAMSTGDNLTYTHTRTGSLFRLMSSSGLNSLLDASAVENQAVALSVDSGNPTGGSGTLDVYITYRIIDL